MPVRVSDEVDLPTNPNCILFAADATEVLVGRPWVDVQRIAARALTRFHDACGLPAAAAFSWRVNLDRMNRRHSQVTLLYIIDGPASAEHLQILEDVAGRSAVFWSPSSIERIPANAIYSLVVRAGTLYQLWTRTDGQCHAYRLVMHGSGVRIHRTTPERARADAFLPSVVHAVGNAVPPEDRNLERMRLAFAQHFARRVIEADGQVLPDEEEFMASVFPSQALRDLGVHDPGSRRRWHSVALRELPLRLGHHDKLALVGLSGFEDYYPSEISGGMRKRAGLARAMALDPEILYFDEPSAGLDPISSRNLDELILELRDSLGATIVMVTHELPSIFAIANNSVFLDVETRTMIASGDPHRMLSECDDPKVRRFLTRGEEGP